MIQKNVEETAKKIASIEIQGARNIAIAAIKAIQEILPSSDLKQLEENCALLAKVRPVEPALRNSLSMILKSFKKGGSQAALEKSSEILDSLDSSRSKIAENGSALIKDGFVILTHCHSSTAIGILKKAKEDGRKFEVICTETRPVFQGRKTALELASLGIPVTMVVDSAVNFFISQADLVLVGCDAITGSGGIVNKIGTSAIALVAKNAGVPFYSASELIKFDPDTKYPESIEMRNPKEIVDDPRFEKVNVLNPAFDLTRPKLIKGIITEAGIFTPKKTLKVAGKFLA